MSSIRFRLVLFEGPRRVGWDAEGYFAWALGLLSSVSSLRYAISQEGTLVLPLLFLQGEVMVSEEAKNLSSEQVHSRGDRKGFIIECANPEMVFFFPGNQGK